MPIITARRKKKIKSDFLKSLAKVGTMTHAAQQTGTNRDTMSDWAKTDLKFADAIYEAMSKCRAKRVDVLKLTAYQRARSGSDTLLIFLLKKWAPDEFGDFMDKAFNEKEGLALTDFFLIAAGRRGKTQTQGIERPRVVDAQISGFQSMARPDRNGKERS